MQILLTENVDISQGSSVSKVLPTHDMSLKRHRHETLGKLMSGVPIYGPQVPSAPSQFDRWLCDRKGG